MVVDWAIKFGRRESTRAGSPCYFFERRSRAKFESYVGPLAECLREFFDVNVVVYADADAIADADVVNVAHRLERMQRHY